MHMERMTLMIIVYDLEMTVQRKHQHLAEVIEIGAVKVEVVNGSPSVTDKFQTFVRPTKQPVLSKHTTEFTGIVQADVERAPAFRDALNAWKEWLGGSSYYLCSWGPDDKWQLLKQCREHETPIDWIKNYNDLQQMYSKLVAEGDTYRQIGLQRALEQLQLVFEGSPHRALDDAHNTARVLISRFSDFKLEENDIHDELRYSTELVYSTGSSSHNPFEKLAGLFDSSVS